MCKVSVILPVYNGEQFIAEAIYSVLAQLWQDWELIVINDGSSDATKEILSTFSDNRITLIHQANRGAAAARNMGLDNAHGDYIAFLDADDLYLNNAFQDCVRFLDEHTELDAIFADGYIFGIPDKDILRLADLRPGIYSGNVLEYEVLNPHVISFPVCTMTRHCVIREHQLRFDVRLSPSEDWDFWIQLSRFANFGYLDKPICKYRIHETNTTQTMGTNRRRADLVRGRLKILGSSWFGLMTVTTRSRFFHQLLVGLLFGETEQQEAIFCSNAFANLPALEKANLLRLVASEYIARDTEIPFAEQCLELATTTYPGEYKSRVLQVLMKLSHKGSRNFLRVRRLYLYQRKEHKAKKSSPLPLLEEVWINNV